MQHEVKIRERWFDRVAAEEQRAVVLLHDRDYQTGDTLSLIRVNQYGNRASHYVERDERGRFVNTWVDDEPITVDVTHVQVGAHTTGVDDGYCVLSVEVRRDG